MFVANIKITFANGVDKKFSIQVDPTDGAEYITDEQQENLTKMFGGIYMGEKCKHITIKTVDGGQVFIGFENTPVIFVELKIEGIN